MESTRGIVSLQGRERYWVFCILQKLQILHYSGKAVLLIMYLAFLKVMLLLALMGVLDFVMFQ